MALNVACTAKKHIFIWDANWIYEVLFSDKLNNITFTFSHFADTFIQSDYYAPFYEM